MIITDIMNNEKYLFKIAKEVLKWAEVKYTEEELADLVMLNLLDIKEEKPNTIKAHNVL